MFIPTCAGTFQVTFTNTCTTADSVSQMLETILAMHTARPQNNIHISVTVHISHHQFPVFDSAAFKIEMHDINCTRVCQLPEPATGELIYIKPVYINQTDICLAVTVIVHRNQAVGIQRPVIYLMQCKVETRSVINSLPIIQIYQQGT